MKEKVLEEVLEGLLRKKLGDFGIDIETHVVAICTDGCSLMKKLGQNLDIDQQLCLAHGVHLAVTKVIYRKKRN